MEAILDKKVKIQQKRQIILLKIASSQELYVTLQAKEQLDNEKIDTVIRRVDAGTSAFYTSEGRIYPALHGSIGIAATIISRRETKDCGRVLRDPEELIEDYREYATKHDCWFDGKVFVQGMEELHAGTQSHVYLDENDTLYKLTSARDGFMETSMADIVDGIAYFNECFPQTAYELIGFGKRSDGAFSFFIKQPFVQGVTLSYLSEIEHNGDTKWTDSECDRVMLSMGFKKNGAAWTDGKYMIYDICGENIMRGDNGIYYVIDADVYMSEGSDSTELTLKDLKEGNTF